MISVEDLARLLHESWRENVETGVRFFGWEELKPEAQEKRRIQARCLMQQLCIETKEKPTAETLTESARRGFRS